MTKHSTPLFSIIIPIYNYGESLVRCVDSVLQQATDDFEIILVNDGSTDKTDEICKTLVLKHTRVITYIYQKNSGPSAARNAGIAKASGQFICFLDADDEMAENALPALTSIIITNMLNDTAPVTLVGGHTSINDSKKITQYPVSNISNDPLKNFKAYLLDKQLAVSNGAIYFHREILQHIKFPEKIRNSEDMPVFALSLANYSCLAVDAILVKVYKHSDSLRNQAHYAIASSDDIVTLIFNSPLLPLPLRAFRNKFLAMRFLSLFRTLYNDDQYIVARHYYIEAIKTKPSIIFRFSYLRKFIKSFL